MTKKIRNNKGFTLIELLAVIVILGVLMIIAIPMVSQYIASARRSAFIATAKAYVSGARYAYLNGDYLCGSTNIDAGSGGAILVPFSQIKVDKNNGLSSFSKKIDPEKNYVIISSKSDGTYTYYVHAVDEGGNGFSQVIDEDVLTKNYVKIKGATVGNAPTGEVSVIGKPGEADKVTIGASCTLDTGL